MLLPAMFTQQILSYIPSSIYYIIPDILNFFTMWVYTKFLCYMRLKVPGFVLVGFRTARGSGPRSAWRWWPCPANSRKFP